MIFKHFQGFNKLEVGKNTEKTKRANCRICTVSRKCAKKCSKCNCFCCEDHLSIICIQCLKE